MTEIEFRQDLAPELVRAEKPIAITQDGVIIGTYFPRHRPTAEEQAHFQQAQAHYHAAFEAAGLTEEDIIAQSDRLLKETRRATR